MILHDYMRQTMMKTLSVGLLLLVAISSYTEAQSPTSGTESKSIAQIIPAESVKWVPARPGQDVSVLWGDPRTGAYGRFNRFAAGFEDRPHYHTRDLRVVIVSGTMIVNGSGRPQAKKSDRGPINSFQVGRRIPTHARLAVRV
jgi:hypothetical protein